MHRIDLKLDMAPLFNVNNPPVSLQWNFSKKLTPGFEPSVTHSWEKTQVKLEISKSNISCHMHRIGLKLGLTPIRDVNITLAYIQWKFWKKLTPGFEPSVTHFCEKITSKIEKFKNAYLVILTSSDHENCSLCPIWYHLMTRSEFVPRKSSYTLSPLKSLKSPSGHGL